MDNTVLCFHPGHGKLVCVDSDGCVINGMTTKHEKCFGPGLIEVFSLEAHREEMLDYWNKINLYSHTRGINRFLGLVMALEFAVKKGYLEMELSPLSEWTTVTKELSNKSLEEWIEKTKEKGENPSRCLTMAREWSLWVNRHVEQLSSSDKQAFDGARKGLNEAKQYADVAVVSSANRGAVETEWGENHLMDMVDFLMTQEYGSKVSCLEKLKNLGYQKDCILMVGDAPGDMQAAKDTGVLFYPILPAKEETSWQIFTEEILPAFLAEQYKGKMTYWQDKMLEALK